MNKNIAAPSVSRNLLAGRGLSAKKTLGQNFLIEPDVVRRIVAAAAIDAGDIVLEVGPGLGAMTQELCNHAGQVAAVEIDGRLVPVLKEVLAEKNNVSIIEGDILKVDIEEIMAKIRAGGDYAPGFVVVANLPYYITTPIIMRFLEGMLPWRRIVIMLQKEVAERISASPGGKDYGALSIAVQYRAVSRRAFNVRPQCFYPRPNVDSSVVILEKRAQPPAEVADEALFFRVVRASFAQRRKTLLNALSDGLDLTKKETADILLTSGIEPGRRGESLTVAEFAAIANSLSAFNKK